MDSARHRAGRRPRGRLRRRISGCLSAGAALVAAGGLYAVLVPQPEVVTAQDAMLERGRQLYTTSCISCHGANLQGVENRGPSLVGVGEAAVHFQVSTGRMPLAREQAQALRKEPLPEFDQSTQQGRRNLDALGAYVQEHGGGPEMPAERGPGLIGDDEVRGGQLFRLNCSSCHNFTGRGGALAEGKYAPSLNRATPEQLYTAMLTGPQAMPMFSDRQLTPEEKQDITAYVLSVRGERNTPGGFNLGEFGPTPEGLVAFTVGMVALAGIALWLGARA